MMLVTIIIITIPIHSARRCQLPNLPDALEQRTLVRNPRQAGALVAFIMQSHDEGS
jgi:hypothetical protein